MELTAHPEPVAPRPDDSPDAALAVPANLAGGVWGWWVAASPAARRALLAAFLGWTLNAFDVMLFSLVLASLMADLGISKSLAGFLGSLTLLASAFGGVVFGIGADRYGRTRALMASILVFSTFTAACGLATTVVQLAIFRVLLGIGMGGEWASGAALVSETWPAAHRGKALGFMQSGWAVGYAVAAAVTALVCPSGAGARCSSWEPCPRWRFCGSGVQSASPRYGCAAERLPRDHGAASREIFRKDLLRITISITVMNAFTMFAAWAYILWIPAYLSLPVAQGGVGLSARAMSGLVIAMQVGTWLGYVTFGFISDTLGRRRTYVLYLISAATLILAYASTRDPWLLLGLGPAVAFFGTGYFSGFGAVTAEIYSTDIRAAAQGFTYNIGRIASAAAPFTVGSVAATHGFQAALSLSAVAFVLAAVAWIWIPETKGKPLE